MTHISSLSRCIFYILPLRASATTCWVNDKTLLNRLFSVVTGTTARLGSSIGNNRIARRHGMRSFTSYQTTEQRHSWNKICCGVFELLLRLRLRSQVQSLHTSSAPPPSPSMSCHVRGDPNRMPPYPSPLTAASLASKDPGDITSSGVRSSGFGFAESLRRSLSTMLISIGHHQLV
jgi:hypothetical protein